MGDKVGTYIKFRKTTDKEYLKTGKRCFVYKQIVEMRVRIPYTKAVPVIKSFLGIRYRTTTVPRTLCRLTIPAQFTDFPQHCNISAHEVVGDKK